MRTTVYIDGFNLYYGVLKGSQYRWLDLKLLFQKILQPHHSINKIKYFTARVSGSVADPNAPGRQDVYLRALQKHIPEIEIIYGHFLSHEASALLANPGLNNPQFVRVIKTEEKGSDVNLAVQLVNDAWLDNYECAVIVSNDSDLAEAMKLVKKHHKQKKLGLLTPSNKRRPSRQLMQYADFKSRIRNSVLAQSQLPSPIPGTKLKKPNSW